MSPHVEGKKFICAVCDLQQPVSNRSSFWVFTDVCVPCNEQLERAELAHDTNGGSYEESN
jgi:hypothetical protein